MKNLKSLRNLFMTLFLVGMVQAADAFTYTRTEVLLVFRKSGNNDVEFNLGSVSNYLAQASGTTVAVTNFNVNLVKANFTNSSAPDLNGVLFAVIVASPDEAPYRNWLTYGGGASPLDRTVSQVRGVSSVIHSVGETAQTYTSTNAGSSYVISAADPSSYTSIAGNNGLNDPSTLQTKSAFGVENSIPASAAFYEINTSTITPKPAAKQIGTFTIDANGVLTFTRAGSAPTPPPSPTILSITRNINTCTVSFTTTNGPTYRLRYTGSAGLTVSRTNWTVVAGSVVGTGNPLSLQDTSADTNRFYSVEVNP